MIRSRIVVSNRFHEISAEISGLARRSCEEAAAAGAAAAHAVASQRGLPIEVEEVRPTEDGWVAGFKCVHPAAWYQDLGTLGNRQRKLKRPPSGKRSHAEGTGIEPLYFLEAGKSEGRKVQKSVVKAGLGR